MDLNQSPFLLYGGGWEISEKCPFSSSSPLLSESFLTTKITLHWPKKCPQLTGQHCQSLGEKVTARAEGQCPLREAALLPT